MYIHVVPHFLEDTVLVTLHQVTPRSHVTTTYMIMYWWCFSRRSIVRLMECLRILTSSQASALPWVVRRRVERTAARSSKMKRLPLQFCRSSQSSYTIARQRTSRGSVLVPFSATSTTTPSTIDGTKPGTSWWWAIYRSLFTWLMWSHRWERERER